MPLSIHCIFSKTFPFVSLFNFHFAVTKLRNSTSVLLPLYKSSLWNLKWPVCLHITLFTLLFLRKTRDWWSGLAGQEVNLTGHWGEDDSNLFTHTLGSCCPKNPRPDFKTWLQAEQAEGMVAVAASDWGVPVGSWAGTRVQEVGPPLPVLGRRLGSQTVV